MSLSSKEKEWADRARRFLKAELNRGTFAATFFLATMKAIGRERLDLADV
jgi:hypothetical protein